MSKRRVKHSKFAGVDKSGETNIHVLDGEFGEVKMQPDMYEFFNSIPLDTDHKAYLLFNVMGASDYYGSNLNGDVFLEEDLKLYHKTFEQGHVYENHENDDPNKSLGKIMFASYNDKMHRVELLIELDKHDPRTVRVLSMLDRGLVPRCSMGCKVFFDTCSICGNKAKTRADYCEHAKKMLGKLLPDGRRVAVINPNPRFFDMSIVTNEADKSSGYLAKVASEVSEENPFDEDEEYMKKEVPSDGGGGENLEDAIEGEEAVVEDDETSDVIKSVDEADECLDEEILDALSNHPLEKIMATMSGLGMKIKPKEFSYLALKPSMGGRGAKLIFRSHKSVGPIVIRKSAGRQSFDITKDFDPDIARILLGEMGKRSFYPAYFGKRASGYREPKPSVEYIDNEKLAERYSDYVNTVKDVHPLKQMMVIRKHAWLIPTIMGRDPLEKDAFLSTDEELLKHSKAEKVLLSSALMQNS